MHAVTAQLHPKHGKVANSTNRIMMRYRPGAALNPSYFYKP
jgi:hypothetical protein